MFSAEHCTPDFITDEKLLKMGIKSSNLCGFCHSEIDSVKHILLNCEISKDQWSRVNDWIIELGMENYHL